ncbi:MAG: preprotein translocase subunit YajC [Calditrichia bacterium]
MVETLYAMAPSGGGAEGGNAFLSFLPLILIIVIMYFLILRPQAKKQKERQKMLDAVQKGDEIVTAGGIHGKVVGLKNNDQVLLVKVDDNVKLEIDRTAVSSIKRSA